MISDILPEVLAECGIDVQSPNINDASFQMRQIAALMNAAGRDIGRRAEWSKAVVPFTFSAGSYFDLPSDFQQMADQGAVVAGSNDYFPARPVTSPELWQMLEKFPSAQQYYQLREGKIYFSPALTGTVTIRYVSRNWLVGRDKINSNADVPVFPEHLLARATIWRWRRQKGLPYDDVMGEFEAAMQAAIKADKGA